MHRTVTESKKHPHTHIRWVLSHEQAGSIQVFTFLLEAIKLAWATVTFLSLGGELGGWGCGGFGGGWGGDCMAPPACPTFLQRPPSKAVLRKRGDDAGPVWVLYTVQDASVHCSAKSVLHFPDSLIGAFCI